jgi:hypothetical protein
VADSFGAALRSAIQESSRTLTVIGIPSGSIEHGTFRLVRGVHGDPRVYRGVVLDENAVNTLIMPTPSRSIVEV